MSIMKQKVEEVRGRIGRKEMTQEEGMNELQAFAMQLNPKAAEMFGSSIMSQQGAMQAEAAQQVQAPNPAQAGGKSFVANMGFTPPTGGQSSANNMFDQLNQAPNVSSQQSYTNTGPRQGPEAMFRKMGQGGGQDQPPSGMNAQQFEAYRMKVEAAKAQQSVMGGNTPISPQGSIPEAQFVKQPYQPLGPNPQAQNQRRPDVNIPVDREMLVDQMAAQRRMGREDAMVNSTPPQGQEQGQQEQPGIFSRIGSGLQSAGQGMGNYAEKLFNDPNRMAMLQGGLSMMNPNSYYDQQGFGSVFQGLQAGLGQAQSGMQGVMSRRKAKSDRALVDAKAGLASVGGKASAGIQGYNQAKKDGYEGTYMEYKKELAEAGKPVTNISMGSKAFSDLNKTLGKKFADSYESAEGDLQSLVALQEGRKIFESGIRTGLGAGSVTAAENFLASRFGIGEGDLAARTSAFAAIMGVQVGQVIKLFGSGTGLSDADREYAQKIAGGEISQPKEALAKLLDINERLLRRKLDIHNEKADRLLNKKGSKDIYFPVKIENIPESLDYGSGNDPAGIR